MKNKNLSYRLSLYFLISAIALTGIVILIGYDYVRDLMFESNRYRLQYEVRSVLDDVRNSMDDVALFTKELALDFDQNSLASKPAELMAVVFNGKPNVSTFGIVGLKSDNRSGQEFNLTLFRSGESIQTSDQRFTTTNEKVNDWINQMLIQSSPSWSEPFYNPVIGSRVMIYGYPFDYLDHGIPTHATFFCSVALNRPLLSLNKQNMIKAGFAVLLNEKNEIVYSPDSQKTGDDIRTLHYFSKVKINLDKLLVDRPSGYQLIHSRGLILNQTVVIYWPISSNNWYMIIAIPENLFISEFKRLLLILIPILLFIGSAMATVTIYRSIKLISPISFLADDSRKMVEESAIEKDINPDHTEILTDQSTLRRLFQMSSVSSLENIQTLSENMDKLKDRLANYRESTIQSTLDKKELEKELKLARDIEMGMVPTNFPLVPNRTDFDCFGKLIPAKIVGGDLFDLFLLGEKYLFISITDTLGKGIPAAMYSVMTRTFIRSIANPITRLGKIMESLNDTLSLVPESDMFATVFLGKLNLDTGELIYCNAGHPHPIILRINNQEELLTQSHGIPLGVKRNLRYLENQIMLAPGESLITYTDGVTEQYNENGAFYGIERLVAVVSSLRNLPAQDIVNKTLGNLAHFQGKAEVHDDLTLVAIKYWGKQESAT